MAGIASIPERIGSLEQVLTRIAPQVDEVHLSLNDYSSIPPVAARFSNVQAVLRDRSNGGDAEKFAGVDHWDRGVVVTCDDDVLYPGDYVKTLLRGLEKYKFMAVVGFHGGTTLGWNGSAVAASHKKIRCLGDLKDDDLEVNVLGTGAMAWHTDHVPVWRELFRRPNMADVQFAGHCRRFGIPMVALAHKSLWLRDICPPEGRRIYESNRDRDGSRCDTTIYREREIRLFDWTAAPPKRPRVRIAIGTCARPQKLLELLEDIERESQWVDVEVSVYEDRSDESYAEARTFCRERDWEWYRFPTKLGKRGYWQMVKRQFRDCRYSRADYFVFLPDDIRLVRHALPRAIETWSRLEDPSTLTLWRLKSLDGKTNWTGVKPRQRDYATEVFHVDGNFICQRETLELLEYMVIDTRKKRSPSSGVGAQISKRLHFHNKRMYRVDSSLTTNNDDGISIMNPDERLRHPALCL